MADKTCRLLTEDVPPVPERTLHVWKAIQLLRSPVRPELRKLAVLPCFLVPNDTCAHFCITIEGLQRYLLVCKWSSGVRPHWKFCTGGSPYHTFLLLSVWNQEKQNKHSQIKLVSKIPRTVWSNAQPHICSDPLQVHQDCGQWAFLASLTQVFPAPEHWAQLFVEWSH